VVIGAAPLSGVMEARGGGCTRRTARHLEECSERAGAAWRAGAEAEDAPTVGSARRESARRTAGRAVSGALTGAHGAGMSRKTASAIVAARRTAADRAPGAYLDSIIQVNFQFNFYSQLH
jgi:hypothetical protein